MLIWHTKFSFCKKLVMGITANFVFFRFNTFFLCSLPVTFFRNIILSPCKRIWNPHKNLRFLIPDTIFYEKYFFRAIFALFANFEWICSKNRTFSNLLQKVETFFLANVYQSLFESHQVLKTEGPNCPNVHCFHDWVKHLAALAWEGSSSCPAHASQHQSPGFPSDAAW